MRNVVLFIAMSLDGYIADIGEIWDDATKYLMGDMYDSVMNYMFRNAVTAYAMGGSSEQATKELEKIRERYPEEAFYAMMNLVGSHDTARILSYLDGIGDDRADKSLRAAFPTYQTTSDLAKQRQYMVAFLQFTYPGAPTIYYGDEIGMVGADDPDDRRAMAWGTGNQELVEWYATLAAIRAACPALSTGAIVPLALGNTNLLSYVRSDADNSLIVIGNNAQSAQTVSLNGTYVDLISGETCTGSVTVPALSGVILAAAKDVKEISVNTADLAPAYDASYTVPDRADIAHTHNYADVVVVSPTCTEQGYTVYTCDCGDSYKNHFVDALGHAYTAAVTAPTCTEQGYTTYTCGCGDSYVTDYVRATGHKWGKWIITVQPDCTHEGEQSRSCRNCGETETEVLPTTYVHCPSKHFVDVNPDSYMHEGIDFMVQNGYMKGTSATTFEPHSDLTRGQLITILYRVAGEPDVDGLTHPFTDVTAGKYYTNAVIWAYNQGIVKGVSETSFDPNASISRAQIATILYRYDGAEEVAEDHLAQFPDGDSVPGYAAAAMNWAVANGIIIGAQTGSGIFLASRDNADRAQIAVITSTAICPSNGHVRQLPLPDICFGQPIAKGSAALFFRIICQQDRKLFRFPNGFHHTPQYFARYALRIPP